MTKKKRFFLELKYSSLAPIPTVERQSNMHRALNQRKGPSTDHNHDPAICHPAGDAQSTSSPLSVYVKQWGCFDSQVGGAVH